MHYGGTNFCHLFLLTVAIPMPKFVHTEGSVRRTEFNKDLVVFQAN